MSVIIRLQNLPWSANALDIRQYFRGLSIPEGGVHIVGGELGDAFIAFSTDEDARQAFQLNNGKIKEIQIQLLLSSRTEMQKVIEAARTAPFMQSVVPQPAAIPTPAIIPQAPVITQPSLPTNDLTKKDEKDSKNNGKDDPKKRNSRDRDRDRGRRRSRSRSRSRDRKDRSRDRRDRRRRDRTRSRDRRDRRDRDRRRRSRSRERTRSRDRDSRRSRDDNKKDNRDSKAPDVIEIKDDGPNPRVWEKKNDMPNEIKLPQPIGLLGNYPGGPTPTSLEDARRSLGLITGLNQNNMQGGPMNNMNNRMPRNDMNNQGGGRDNSWQRKTRFENSEMGMMNQFNQGNMPIRPNINQNMNMGGLGSNIFPNQAGGMRLPMQPQMQDNFGMNRPFLARPGTTFPEQFGRQDPRNQQFGMNNDRSDESFRNDRNKMDCCVQLRPYFGGYGEVRKFFHGLYISNTGVKFVTENGKRTGIVYIKFVRPDGKEQALSRSGMIIRGVPVEVAHLDDEEWEHYGEEEHLKSDDNSDNRKEESISSPRLHHFTCVVVEDLSEFAKDHDILKLFSEYTIVSVHMVVNKQYRQQAYVQFSKEEDAKNAIADKTSHVIGGKPVTVRPISDDIFNDVVRQQANGEIVIDAKYSQNDNNSPVPDNFQSNIPTHIITDCVMLNGLPLKTTDRDVLDFFSDIGIVPVRIHIMMNKFGPTGECFCEFNNPDEAVCALDKNEMPLGTGTVRVELCHRRDMERALGIPPSSGAMNQGPRFPNRFGPRGPNLLGPGPRPPPNMMRRRPPGPGMRYDGPVESMGPQGCVVAMENVPFKAGVDEILDFFGNFELSTHNVFRRFNDNGAPTGDARVTFNNQVEAHRAVEECNKHKIRDRTIFLRVL